jgi:hypothetical protein
LHSGTSSSICISFLRSPAQKRNTDKDLRSWIILRHNAAFLPAAAWYIPICRRQRNANCISPNREKEHAAAG